MLKDKSAKAEDPETEVPEPADSRPADVSAEPVVRDSGVIPTEIPILPPPIDPVVPSVVEPQAEPPSANVPQAEVSAASLVSGVHDGEDISHPGNRTEAVLLRKVNFAKHAKAQGLQRKILTKQFVFCFRRSVMHSTSSRNR